MIYNNLELEIRRVLALIERWREFGSLPAIEKEIALGRLQNIYLNLLNTPGEAISESTAKLLADVPDAAPLQEADGETVSGAYAPGDESFEAAAEPEKPKADDDGDFAACPAPEEEQASGHASESHMQQEYGSHDTAAPCPGPDGELASGHAAETHMQQEYGSHDTTGPDTAPVNLPAGEEVLSEDNSDDNLPPADDKAPEPPVARASGPQREKYYILGIEISEYGRHEIIDTLFRGDVALFESECETINEMRSLEDALVYIGQHHRWIPENAATIKFIDLLEKRFN